MTTVGVVEQWQHRIALGRWLALVGGAGYAGTRAAVYGSGSTGRPPQGIELISGVVPVQVWAILWGLAAVLCIVDAFRGHMRYGLPAIVGLGFVWATGFAGAWVLSGFTSSDWFGAAAYGFASGLILGLLVEVGARRRDVGGG